MASNILIVGASGALGTHLMQECNKRNLNIRALTHSDDGYDVIKEYTNDIWYADASEEKLKLQGITEDIDYVISALGKSISLFSPTPDSFYEKNYKANAHILREAIKNKVKRFFYISMKGADSASEFTIPRTHKLMEEELEKSGLEYTIIRPVGFYSGLNDLVIMAKHKIIPLIGDGEAKTNSIFHGDLANYVMAEFLKLPKLIEVGGPKVHTREEMASIIKNKIGGHIIKVPTLIAQSGSQIPKFLKLEEFGDKLEYFSHIMSHDMIGEKHGTMSFEAYLDQLDIEGMK